MGGRGASSGISDKGKIYGSEYHSLFTSGNIKFIKPNEETSLTAPMETMTKNRVYVTVTKDSNGNDRPKYITYYDKTNKRYKQIDLTGKIHYKKNGESLPLPHTHLGYEHSENGSRKTDVKEKRMVARVNLLWYDYVNK